MTGDIQNSYLIRLTARLAAGLRGMKSDRAARHRDFLLGFQRADGGFAGREGGSDLYYTSFAVRGLALLDGLNESRCRVIAGYLKSAAERGSYSLIDLVSWLYSAATIRLAGGPAAFDGDLKVMADEVSAALESFRRPDGGYAKTGEGGSGSTYHTFLAVLCYELLGLIPPEPDSIVRFLLSRRRDDGGFVEIGPMRRSGTNPTAAAAVLLRRLEAVNPEVFRGIESFLDNVKGPEGGLRANTQIPFCDLLSTFTGLLMADDLGLAGRIDSASCRQFASSLELSGGGFRGASWDGEADPEYTFYGLGTLALLKGGSPP
ncbi:MAG TPA: prenyltransferase/squalene oxidase repeat-containing protein [Blastocatellia bacterium]|nr:prenyltransferase/squalene oxidase repeat-containing protein [Blastocatellia bacterium]